MGKKKKVTFSERRDKFLNFQYNSPLRQILSYLWDYKRVFIIVLIFGIIQSVLFLTFPLFLGPAVDVLVNPSIPLDTIFPIFFTIVSIQIIVGILFGIRIYFNRWIGANVIYNLRNDLFRTIQIMNFEWLDKNKTGDLISRTTSDVNLLKEFLGNNFQFFIRQCVTFSFSFVILFLINIELAFFVLVISPALFYVLLLFRKKLRPVFKRSREKYSDLTHVIQESVQGIKVIKSFGRESHELEKFSDENDGYYEKSLSIIKLQAFFDPIIYLIDNIAFLIVLLLGGVFVLEGGMTFGDLFAFVMVLNFSVEPLYFLSRFLGNLPQITETCERVVSILNSETNVREKKKAKELPPIRGDIEFKNVSFEYNVESEHYILKNLNFKISAGENIAILGPTGSGKSTLVKLIPRFYDTTEGDIFIDGMNIKEVNFKSLRKQIGYVSQERILFSRSIRENIAFGKKNLDLESVKKAAIASDIHQFIVEELPNKYNTEVSERGTSLSGGQKQRLSIARALAVNPKILILDDATSSVDVDTEYKIQRHFQEVFTNSTTFLITQRLSSIRNADRIIILDKGKIAQIGTHDDLMSQKDSIYRTMYMTLKVEERA